MALTHGLSRLSLPQKKCPTPYAGRNLAGAAR
jgi:hypothetical protein